MSQQPRINEGVTTTIFAKNSYAEVGKPDAPSGEIVLMIMRAEPTHGPFYICTYNRGVVHDGPILADVLRSTAVEFEGA
jgi:hypothetical protein